MFKVYFFLLCMIVILPSLALTRLVHISCAFARSGRVTAVYLLHCLFVDFTSLDALFEITIRGDFQSISERMGLV